MNTIQMITLLSFFGLFAITLVVIMRMLMLQKEHVKQLQADVADFQRQLTMYVDGSVGLGKRLIRAEQQLRALSKDHASLLSRQSNLTYLEASQLLRQGADVDQLMKQCGVSQTEANLMALLHKAQDNSVANNGINEKREQKSMEQTFATEA